MMIADEPAAKEQNLHVLFLPLFSQGHMIPLFDTARLFAAQDGVQATFVTTLANASSFTEAVDQTQQDYSSPLSDKSPMRGNINVEIIPFPYENEKACLSSSDRDAEYTTKGYQMFVEFLEASEMQLQRPLETMIDRLRPISCLVTDIFLPWTSKVADQFGIPRLVFHGSSFFATSIMDVMLNQQRTQKVFHSYEEEFEMDPGFPSNIKLTKIDIEFLGENPVAEFLKSGFEKERRSFGTIMNSFYELESEYADHSRQVLGKRAWTIGPISLCINRSNSDKAKRGKKAAIDELECLKWLDSKLSNSVIYISFGSQADIPSAQLREIAIALEASELNFIWVIKKATQKTSSEQQQAEEEWLPDSEFEERNRGKGLIIRGWAPQVLVLDHQATGAFVTHCGWNSVLEGISAGMPMVTWPLFAEQFLSEKQVVEILKIGVPVRSKKLCNRSGGEVGVVGAEAIRMAMERVMTRNEAVEIRKRADEVMKMALSAVQTGGSSHEGLNDLLKQLKSCQINDRVNT